MPIATFCTVCYFGWIKKDFLPTEIKNGSSFKTEGFYRFCLRWLAPVFCAFILVGQIDSFFGLGIF